MDKLDNVTILKANKGNYQNVISLLKVLDLPPEGVIDHFQNFFIALEDDNIVGSVGIEVYGKIGLLRSVGVAKNFQGKGLGKKLVERIHEYSKTKGLEKIYLFTETAEQFFENQFGYKIISRDQVDDKLSQSEEFKMCESAPTMLKTM